MSGEMSKSAGPNKIVAPFKDEAPSFPNDLREAPGEMRKHTAACVVDKLRHPVDCLPAAECQKPDAEGSHAYQSKYFVQNILEPSLAEVEFEEGRLWSPPPPDPFLAVFYKNLRQAEDLEKEIVNIEIAEDQLLTDTKGELAPLEKSQIVACFQAWKLVYDGKDPERAMEQYALKRVPKRMAMQQSRVQGSCGPS